MNQNSNIKSWALEDRPREKMYGKGPQSLTDTELLAILIGTGTRDESAVDLAGRVMKDVSHRLSSLSRLDIHDLMGFKGIGQAKAVQIAAALELGRRRTVETPLKRTKISGSNDAYRTIGPLMADLSHEEFWIILLNRANRVIDTAIISKGGITGTVVDARLLFEAALRKKACALILAHNHPSGNHQPSESDRKITKKLKEAGKVLDIEILDHLIITESSYFSFADESLL